MRDIEKFTLPDIPAAIPGLYRWLMTPDSHPSFANLHIQVYKEARSFWTGKITGKWVTVESRLVHDSEYSSMNIPESAGKMVKSLAQKHQTAGISTVMATRS